MHCVNPRFVTAQFQSTPPSREATCTKLSKTIWRGRFNPRPPHGRRLFIRGVVTLCETFQSTPPSREATGSSRSVSDPHSVSIHAPLTGGDRRQRGDYGAGDVSIHAPLTGGDGMTFRRVPRAGCFNPRPPHGRRLSTLIAGALVDGFNPRPPHGRRRIY